MDLGHLGRGRPLLSASDPLSEPGRRHRPGEMRLLVSVGRTWGSSIESFPEYVIITSMYTYTSRIAAVSTGRVSECRHNPPYALAQRVWATSSVEGLAPPARRRRR